jgi:outer membrane protein assembly factor BamB
MNTEVVWSFGVSGGADMLLAAGDGDDLYFASEDGVVYSLDGRTGAERWRYEIGEHVSSADLAGDGLLHVGTESGSLLGLRVSDGFNIYRSAFTDENVLTAAVPGEAVYVVTETGSVQRHPPEGGPRLWALDLHSSVVAPPVVGSDGIVYVGTIDPGSVNAISPDGQLLWSVETGPVEVSPAIGSLYVATAWGQLLSFDERNGAILWEQAIETPAFPPVISHNGDVYTLGEGNLSRISPDGEYQWHSGNLTSVRYKSVAVDQDGNAYLLDRAGDLWAIDWDGSLQMLATT